MRTITSVELARLAGVSQSTVSRCLNNSPLVSDETKARVKKIAEEYDFQFNTNARGLKTNRTGVVGYIFSKDFSGFANHHIQSHLYYCIRTQLLAHDIDVVPVFDDRMPGERSTIEKSIRNCRYDVLIFTRQSVTEHVRKLLKETKIPYIFIYDTDEYAEEPFMISPRHTEIGRLVGNSFCEAGYRNFVEVTGPSARTDVVNKHTGFVEALTEHGAEIRPENILCANYNLEQAKEVTLAHLDQFVPGTAVFAHNDMIALGVLDSLKQAGVRIPEDVALVGSDNVIMARWFHPYLTTVAIDYDQIIALTTQWVLDATDGNSPKEYRHFLNQTLVVRDTFVPKEK